MDAQVSLRQCCQIPFPCEIVLFYDCSSLLALLQVMFLGVRKKGSGKAGNWFVILCTPHLVHHLLKLCGVLV